MTRPLAEVVARTSARGVAQRNGSLILLALGATVSTDFHALDRDQLAKLDAYRLTEGYRAPCARRRNGSTLRYYFAYVQRRARPFKVRT